MGRVLDISVTARANRRIGPVVDEYREEQRTDTQTAVVDILTDLQHFCASDGADFAEALISACRHFRAEGGAVVTVAMMAECAQQIARLNIHREEIRDGDGFRRYEEEDCEEVLRETILLARNSTGEAPENLILDNSNCPKCGVRFRTDDGFEDDGEGEEDGRFFIYCSEACRAAH